MEWNNDENMQKEMHEKIMKTCKIAMTHKWNRIEKKCENNTFRTQPNHER